MEILDGFLEKSLWFADNENVTIADLSILSNVSQIKACGYNISKHCNLSRWYEQCKSLKGFDENEVGANEVGKFFKTKLGEQF
jgi:glutathione S-transferase